MKTSFRKRPQEKVSKALKADVIIPTLNEEGSIGEVIHAIRSHSFPIEVSILVVDGGSTDQTIEICTEENVRLLLQRGKGKGSAMKEAVQASDADIVIFMDGDGTYSVDDMEKLLEPLLNDKADMVVGSRLLGRREKGSISGFNTIGNRLFNKTINFAMKSKVTDSLSGYRSIRRDVFRDLILFSEHFEIEVEMTVEALAKGYRILEVPINYGTRKGTTTKLNSVDVGINLYPKSSNFLSFSIIFSSFFSTFSMNCEKSSNFLWNFLFMIF